MTTRATFRFTSLRLAFLITLALAGASVAHEGHDHGTAAAVEIKTPGKAKACCPKDSADSTRTAGEKECCKKKGDCCQKEDAKTSECCRKHARGDKQECCTKHENGDPQACCKKGTHEQ